MVPPSAAAAPRAGRPATGTKSRPLRVTEGEVVAALETLYADQVRPSAAVLLRRLGERAAARSDRLDAASAVALPGAEGLVPRIDTAWLRQVCERSRRIELVQDNGEYAALLRGRPDSFVDTSSNNDPYPEAFWRALSSFFATGAGRELVLPGGRYACARALMALRLPVLEGYSLGSVCHIVQLAIWQRCILGHSTGQIVPYEKSESVVKDRCAELQEPAPRKDPALKVADLAMARATLETILCRGPLPLPNVKRVFKAEFGLDLSETAFGHRRLGDLLQDPRFSDICTLQMAGNTCVVLPVAQTAAKPASSAPASASEATSAWQTSHTFIHFKAPPPTPLQLPRARSVPAAASRFGRQPSQDDSDTETSAGTGTNSQQAPTPSDSDTEDCAPDYVLCTPSPRSPAHLRGRYSYSPDSSPFSLANLLYEARSSAADVASGPEQAPRPFCVEPLPLECLEEVGSCDPFPFPTPSPQYGFGTTAATQRRCAGGLLRPSTATPVQDFACATPSPQPQYPPQRYQLAR